MGKENAKQDEMEMINLEIWDIIHIYVLFLEKIVWIHICSAVVGHKSGIYYSNACKAQINKWYQDSSNINFM